MRVQEKITAAIKTIAIRTTILPTSSRTSLSIPSPGRTLGASILHLLARATLTPALLEFERQRNGMVSVQPEIHLHVDLHRDRDAVLARRLEPPFADRLDGLLIQPHAECPLNADVARAAVRPHDQPHNHRALVLGLARLLGKFGIGGVKCARRRHPAT